MMALTEARVERSRIGVLDAQDELPAVVPSVDHEKSAVRAPPMCKIAVGLGAKRVRTAMGSRFSHDADELVGAALDREALGAPAQHATGEVADAVEAALPRRTVAWAERAPERQTVTIGWSFDSRQRCSPGRREAAASRQARGRAGH